MAANIILLNKPFAVLSQFTDKKNPENRKTLADYIPAKFSGFYPAGRLDFDSEGLLLLTNDGKIQQRISHPKFKLAKTYWVQVEGDINEAALAHLRRGVELNDGPAKALKASYLDTSDTLWPRHPPIRIRHTIPAPWISLTINEGRNRQVRRMTAAVGFPTLRLIRAAIGHWQLANLQPGDFTCETVHLPQ